MLRRMNRTGRSTDLLFSLFVLGLLFCFTYANLVEGPYAGFYFNPSDGQVLDVYVETDLLREGDIIQQVGALSFSQYASDVTRSFFEDLQRGDVINILLERDGEILTVLWPFPGFNLQEFRARLFNIWWLGYIFWGVGLATQLFVRPKDARQKLLTAMSYLTAFWIVLGDMSSLRIWDSSLLLRAVTWLMLPVYLHLHWNFPRPLARLPGSAWIVLYLVGFALALMELLQWLPRSLYALGFLIALLGSILLLFAHFVLQPLQRRDVGLLLAAILAATIPPILLSILRTIGNIPEIGPLALFTLLAMPGAYFYVIYRRQLGGLEMRANRFVAIYLYLILVGTTLLLLLTPAILLSIPSETMVFLAIGVSTLTAFLTIFLFPMFQSFIESRLLGIKLPYRNLLETYSKRIVTSTSIASLMRLLGNEVFPSLFVRQFAFFRVSNNHLSALLVRGLNEEQLPKDEELASLIARADVYLPLSNQDWIRLILPLKVGEDLIGLWLLGHRDPDDFYFQVEIPILQSLANQTGIALSNILQTSRLRKMYADDIERNEKNRLQLALDLHDSVLNQLAILRLNVDDTHVSPKFQGAYDEVTRRLREIVTDLRPPMLGYGLKFAIEELADNLMERSKDTIKVTGNVQAEGKARYAENIERHIFRIMQEACENSLRHGCATRIDILGKLGSESIRLSIQDNGIGFQADGGADLDSLLANKHFGLAGMVERGFLIGASVEIDSQPGAGTHIQIDWTADEN